MIWLWLACESAEVREARCMRPIADLISWRNDRFRAPPEGPPAAPATPDSLLREERDRVDAAVADMQPLRDGCRRQWSIGLWSDPDSPSLRLRDEALRRVLELPAVDYTEAAVGYSRQTTDGRAGVPDK